MNPTNAQSRQDLQYTIAFPLRLTKPAPRANTGAWPLEPITKECGNVDEAPSVGQHFGPSTSCSLSPLPVQLKPDSN